MASQADFDRSLGRLAKLCNFELDPDIVELYDRALSTVGYAAVCRVLDEMAMSTSPQKRQWPSVNEIKRACGVDVPPPLPPPERIDDEACRVAAQKIIEGVARFGSIMPGNVETKTPQIRAHIGELAWEIVRLKAGWNAVCDELTVENQGIIGAQMRELGRAILDRRRMGLDMAPSLPPAPGRCGDSKALGAIDTANLFPNVLDVGEPRK